MRISSVAADRAERVGRRAGLQRDVRHGQQGRDRGQQHRQETGDGERRATRRDMAGSLREREAAVPDAAASRHRSRRLPAARGSNAALNRACSSSVSWVSARGRVRLARSPTARRARRATSGIASQTSEDTRQRTAPSGAQCGATSGQPDPLVGAVGEDLVLPDRHPRLSSSISSRQAANASPRCGQDTPTTTARSPTARSPTRWTAASARTGCAATTFSATAAQLVERRWGARSSRGRSTPRPPSWSRTVPTNSAIPPAPGRRPPRSTSSTDSGSSRTPSSRITPGRDRRVTPRRFRRAARTSAAVPTRATAAPAAPSGRVLAAQPPGRRRAWWPRTCSSSSPSAVGVVVRRAPAGLAQPASRTTHGCTTYGRSLAGRRGHAQPVQPLGGAEGQRRRQLDAPHARRAARPPPAPASRRSRP